MASIISLKHCYLGYSVDLWSDDGDDFDYAGCFSIAYGGAAVHAGRLHGYETRAAALDAAWCASLQHINNISAAA